MLLPLIFSTLHPYPQVRELAEDATREDVRIVLNGLRRLFAAGSEL